MKKWNFSIVLRALAILFFAFLLFDFTKEISSTYAEQQEITKLLEIYNNSAS